MHDCPACRVPLHGYEEVCPSCGTRQMPSQGGGRVPYGTAFKPEEPRVNVIPFVLVFLGFAVFLVIAMQSTWIGQLARKGNEAPDPMEKMTYLDARNIIDSELNKGLASVGAKNTRMNWHLPGAAEQGSGANADAADARGVDSPVELTVETTLPSADVRKQVVDPVKPYMEKAKLYTLMMNDSKSHAHWTYNLQPATSPVEPDAGLNE